MKGWEKVCDGRNAFAVYSSTKRKQRRGGVVGEGEWLAMMRRWRLGEEMVTLWSGLRGLWVQPMVSVGVMGSRRERDRVWECAWLLRIWWRDREWGFGFLGGQEEWGQEMAGFLNCRIGEILDFGWQGRVGDFGFDE
ncbi:hypothetical protein MRB53_009799 [Persea americana]|uniref:Uncharacterized protein n=1 Tax=Persea americana TaxID=3435 RepID=A0ACC2LQ26_PERAE|nr:hypothetical protein MRB53_009799 [Persea americana]